MINRQLLIATHNPGKLFEFRKYFGLYLPELKLISLDDLGIKHEPEENGNTFEANALIKARAYAKISHCLTLADDGGLEIDALGGQPGVLSRRWPGYEASDTELIAMSLNKLKGVPVEKRTAKLRVVVTVVEPEGKVVASEEGGTEGIVPEEASPLKMKGFPFRAVLFLPKFNKFYQDLTNEEHELVNHRQEIVRKIALTLKNFLNRREK